jgi:hypothetical protein
VALDGNFHSQLATHITRLLILQGTLGVGDSVGVKCRIAAEKVGNHRPRRSPGPESAPVFKLHHGVKFSYNSLLCVWKRKLRTRVPGSVYSCSCIHHVGLALQLVNTSLDYSTVCTHVDITRATGLKQNTPPSHNRHNAGARTGLAAELHSAEPLAAQLVKKCPAFYETGRYRVHR